MTPTNTVHKKAGHDPVSFGATSVETGTADERRYIGSAELLQIIPISEMTLWRWQRDPRVNFPRATKLGANGRNYWWLPDVRRWERQRTGEDA